MPSEGDRLEASRTVCWRLDADEIQILEALSRKLTFHPSVDLSDIAAQSQGYSGADLQAVVYNAHLEVVHASIDSAMEVKGKGKGKGKAGAMEKIPEKARKNYRQIAPEEDADSGSLAERAAMTSRVSRLAFLERVLPYGC